MDPIVILNHAEAQKLYHQLSIAFRREHVYTLRFAIDDGGVKVKINDYTWSPAIGYFPPKTVEELCPESE